MNISKASLPRKHIWKEMTQSCSRKVVEYLIQVKQPKEGNPPLEGATGDIIDPLLGKNENQVEDEISDTIMMEEDKENIKLKNVHNGFEVGICSEDSDEEPIISYRHHVRETGDEFLDVGGLERNFQNTKVHKYMETLAEVYQVDSG